VISLRVWALPRPGDAEFGCFGPDETEVDLADICDAHKLHLEGHDHAVRVLAARGRTLELANGTWRDNGIFASLLCSPSPPF